MVEKIVEEILPFWYCVICGMGLRSVTCPECVNCRKPMSRTWE